MQLDDALRASALVQAIDVLGDDAGDQAGRFQPRHREVTAVGLGLGDGAPAQMARISVAVAGERSETNVWYVIGWTGGLDR